MSSASFAVCQPADDTASEELKTFMAELDRLETASQSRARELAHAKAAERELSEQVAAVAFAAQKARHARLQTELKVAATQVGTEVARREAEERRRQLGNVATQLESLNARRISLDSQKEQDQRGSHLCNPSRDFAAGETVAVSTAAVTTLPHAFVDDCKLCRSLTCVHGHTRLSNLFLVPLAQLLDKLRAQYTASLGDTQLLERAAPERRSLWWSDAFEVWLLERACGALTGDDMHALSFIASVKNGAPLSD
ncbi:hypothetical protein GH5_03419 [Leishmania sp. Ghana 2012 LV757]|uniref:hypothetical protein n=1 Tax=Leishmania sp. Ghana 2012 LV757 TaxID=2803181 RepID=UPI001B651FE3|nr:hypothetical protein GH5_03419 [Leishmania sp. Ghana 2012 LV757]